MLGSNIPKRWVLSLVLVGLVATVVGSYSTVWGAGGSTIPGIVAKPFMKLHRDSTDYSATSTWDGATQDGATGVVVGIKQIVEDDGSATSTLPTLGGYAAELRYDGTCINVLGIRNGKHWTTSTSTIDNTATSSVVTTFSGYSAGDTPTSTMAFAVLRLIADKDTTCNLEVVFTDLMDTSGNTIVVATSTPVIGEFKRGNALQDASLNIGDALFTAQYLVGIRGGCRAIKRPGVAAEMTCINPVNTVDVIPDGNINIGDVLFIKQQLVGIRDANFQ